MIDRVVIDTEACMASGNCVFNAPGVFDQDESGTSYVIDVASAPEEVVRFAARSCPVGAIRVEPSDQQ